MSGIGRQDSCLEKRVHGFGVSFVAVDLRVCVLFEINGFLYMLYTGLGVHCFLVLGFELCSGSGLGHMGSIGLPTGCCKWVSVFLCLRLQLGGCRFCESSDLASRTLACLAFIPMFRIDRLLLGAQHASQNPDSL